MALESPEHLLSSARYDPNLVHALENSHTSPASGPSPYLVLPYHRDRLQSAALAFGWTDAAASLDAAEGLARLRDALDRSVRAYEQRAGVAGAPLKVRILLDRSARLTIELAPTPKISPTAALFASHAPTRSPSDPSPIRVVLDPAPTPPSLLTSHKTTSRTHYLAARSRAGLTSYDSEVLLWNPAGQVTEGSITNVAFWRDAKWVTPSLDSGGLGGVMRRWLLEHGVWTEGTVNREHVRSGERVLLSNGLRGVVVGQVVGIL